MSIEKQAGNAFAAAAENQDNIISQLLSAIDTDDIEGQISFMDTISSSKELSAKFVANPDAALDAISYMVGRSDETIDSAINFLTADRVFYKLCKADKCEELLSAMEFLTPKRKGEILSADWALYGLHVTGYRHKTLKLMGELPASSLPAVLSADGAEDALCALGNSNYLHAILEHETNAAAFNEGLDALAHYASATAKKTMAAITQTAAQVAPATPVNS